MAAEEAPTEESEAIAMAMDEEKMIMDRIIVVFVFEERMGGDTGSECE